KFDSSELPSTSAAALRHEQTPNCQDESRVINMSGVDLLRFYVDQLKASMDRRRMIFTESGLLAVIEDRGDMPFDPSEPPPHSLKRQYESQRFDNLLAQDFCKTCPGFDLFEQMEKAIFYRACSLSYCLLDIAWITVEAFKHESENPQVMFTDGSTCTVNDMSYGWEDEEDICANEKKKLVAHSVSASDA
uniref:NR LBD domain-containing protein n=1 Tax=Caenorhabditis japonica TaxID=281687 RepID=A0A8R1EH81_CAEJA